MLWVSLLEGPNGKIHETSLMSLIIRILKIYLCKVGAGWKSPYGTHQGLKRVADIIIKMVSLPWVPNACNNFLCYLFFLSLFVCFTNCQEEMFAEWKHWDVTCYHHIIQYFLHLPSNHWPDCLQRAKFALGFLTPSSLPPSPLPPKLPYVVHLVALEDNTLLTLREASASRSLLYRLQSHLDFAAEKVGHGFRQDFITLGEKKKSQHSTSSKVDVRVSFLLYFFLSVAE